MSKVLRKISDLLKKSVRNWVGSTVVLVALSLCIVSACLLYKNSENTFLKAKSNQIADGIGERLQAEIFNRIALLKIMGRSVDLSDPSVFAKLAPEIVKEFSDFYAINYVNTQGIISRTYPEDRNRLALGQNLLERHDVRDYLIGSKDSGDPWMSHRLITYQGVPAITLYVPVYTHDNQFSGWLNAVLDFDSWLAGFMEVNALDQVRIAVKWEHSESEIVDRGVRSVEYSFAYVHEILNQKLDLEIGFAPGEMEIVRARHYAIVVILGSIILLLALSLILKLHWSQRRLRLANEHLAFKNNLLSSLSHDLSAPLTILGLIMDRIFSSKEPPSVDLQQSANRSLKVIAEMLESAKLLHAQKMGVVDFKTEAVCLSVALREAIESVSYQAEKKGVKIHTSSIPDDLFVMAQLSTFVNNVLLNVLTNAVKFSPKDGEIKISAAIKKNRIHLLIEDEGCGLSTDQLSRLKKSLSLKSTTGSRGERGTGLGLLQVRGFMEAYGGALEIENNEPKGCRIILIFRPEPPKGARP